MVNINVDLEQSMNKFLLGGGEESKILALMNTRIMIHNTMGGSQGQVSDFKVEAEKIFRIIKNMVHKYEHMT